MWNRGIIKLGHWTAPHLGHIHKQSNAPSVLSIDRPKTLQIHTMTWCSPESYSRAEQIFVEIHVKIQLSWFRK